MSSKIRLYFLDEIQSDLISHLPKDQSHYLRDVMRLKIGGKFLVFNDKGEWDAVVTNYEKKGAKIKILKKVREQENEKNIWLAFSPIKQNSLNFIIQKGTELGVKKFFPVLTERTIVKDINIHRTKKIIVEASEQSNRIFIPEIYNLQTLKNFLSQFPKNGNIIFCNINSRSTNLKKILQKKSEGPICVLIGPEGDFSETERQLIIEKYGANSLSLAKNILRAETAALAAIAIVNYYTSN